ncbi:hypothetical protein SAMN04487950_0538 [Halogranum rubrum]|uniref:Transglutaminase-like superfamily protein n=1 Tax=Halogranum rubrum TaxID=553466 RepID=A0A1I4BIL3_9EURY|nr:hypothetical protein [Halogranum rubrum]SFK67756.1 hypothetical protein SAMN04487950_0538 [Halogranum rubrum]
MSEESHHSRTGRGSGRTRRQVLGTLGVTAVTGLAGCLDGGGSDDSTTTPGRISRRYAVDVDEGRAAFHVDIPKSEYVTARDRSRSFTRAANAARESPALERLGRQIARTYSSDADRLLAAQAVVTDIEYARDIESTDQREYIRYPAETIAERMGDCEDLAFLLAGLLSSSALDFRTGFVIPEGHCAVLVDTADVPATLLASDPLTVRFGGREYVYVEAVEAHAPGAWARDYGTRSLLVAYRDGWYPLDTAALADHSIEMLTDRDVGSVVEFFQ